jgi:hypothetical protein
MSLLWTHTQSLCAVPSGQGHITSAVWLNGMDVDEAIEVLTVRYRRALRDLKAAIPDDLPDVAWALEPSLANEQNSMQCSYGFGRVVSWPWALHLPVLGYCDPECVCQVLLRARADVVKTALGEWPRVWDSKFYFK